MEKKSLPTVEINKDTIIAFLRANRPELENRFGITKIALFGSYARGALGYFDSLRPIIMHYAQEDTIYA